MVGPTGPFFVPIEMLLLRVLLFCYTASLYPFAGLGRCMIDTGVRYKVIVEEVHSADDFVLLVDLGVAGLYKRTRARLHGVDAPNAYKVRADTDAGRLRDEVKNMVVGVPCEITIVSEGRGGWVVELYMHSSATGETVHINGALRARGYVYERRDAE